MKQVLFAPDVEEDLYELIRILVDKQYLGTYDFAISYVEDMINYIQNHIESYPRKKIPSHFALYGVEI
ncbi:MAG: hypothetical protein IKO28_00835 [Prevotella sp.]|nr:hypothetical protein [Prevotella sp.]